MKEIGIGDHSINKRCLAPILLLGLLWTSSTQGFGADGHRVVGLIAEQNLCAAARTEVRHLLGPQTLAVASLWADQIKYKPPWEHTYPWHYINVPDSVAIEDAPRSPKGDILWAIDHFRGVLADPAASRRDQTEALKYIVHFVGDIHLPLHVGRAEDRGGTDIIVTFDGEKDSLHEFWDDRVMREDALPPQRYAAAVAPLAVNYIEEWQSSTVLQWAAESKSFRAYVYSFEHDGRVVELDTEYLIMARNIVNLRLAQAGIRLAGLLNKLYCDSR